MIPADLLFGVDPIVSIYSIGVWDFLFIGVASIILMGVYFLIHGIKKRLSSIAILPSKKISYTLPSIEDRDFEEKSARKIRTIIGYPEKIPEAHTAREISDYKGDHELVPLLFLLENHEYQGKNLTKEERREVLKSIRKYLIR